MLSPAVCLQLAHRHVHTCEQVWSGSDLERLRCARLVTYSQCLWEGEGVPGSGVLQPPLLRQLWLCGRPSRQGSWQDS